MKPRTTLEETADTTRLSRFRRLFGDVILVENLEQRALSGTITADNSDDFTSLRFEGDLIERPE